MNQSEKGDLFKLMSWRLWNPNKCHHNLLRKPRAVYTPQRQMLGGQGDGGLTHTKHKDKVRKNNVTFAGQSVSLLVLPFWLRPAVWVLWHYLLPGHRGLPDCPRLSSFPCQEVYWHHQFWLHCPEIQTWVDVLSWALKGQVVPIHLLPHLFFVGYSLHRQLLLFFSFLGHCWYYPG